MSKMNSSSYMKFMMMLIVSFFIMYFVMFLNMDSMDHYHTSMTRIYMSILMVTPMAIVMMVMMSNMYENKSANSAIVIIAALLFIVTLKALRTQTPVGDVQYMKAMIPHHSSAIMTSKHASIRDPEVRKLADSIIASQEREIAQMQEMINRIE